MTMSRSEMLRKQDEMTQVEFEKRQARSEAWRQQIQKIRDEKNGRFLPGFFLKKRDK